MEEEKYKNHSKNKRSLNYMEVIIISVIIGVIAFLILSYTFADVYFVNNNGTRFNYPFNSNSHKYVSLNYTLGVSGFIISSGLSYLFLNRKRKQ